MSSLISDDEYTGRMISMELILEAQYYSSTDLYTALRETLAGRLADLGNSNISTARLVRPNFKKREYSITWTDKKDPKEIIQMIMDYGVITNASKDNELNLIRNFSRDSSSKTLDIVIPELGITLRPCQRTIDTLAEYEY